MKKLITFLLVVLLIGGGLAIGGAAAGGELYGSYYNGKVHSIRESLHDVDGLVRSRLRWRAWYDADGYHSGWFGGTVDEAINDALDDLHDDWDDAWEDGFAGRPYSIVDGHKVYVPDDLPTLPNPDIEKLEFSFDRGSYRIIEGDAFDCSGALVTSSNMHGGTWELSLRRKNSTETTVTLPKETFEKLECNIGAASVTIDMPLAVDKAEFNIGAGQLIGAQPLDASKIEVECGAGSASLQLAGSADEYGYDIAAAMGRVSLNDAKLVSGIAGTSRTERDGTRMLDLNVGAGTIDLFTED